MIMSGRIYAIRSYLLSKYQDKIGGKSCCVAVRYNGEPLNNLSSDEKNKLEEAWYEDDIDGQLEHAYIEMCEHYLNKKKYYTEQNDGPFGTRDKE